MTKIFPVIHHINAGLTKAEVKVAFLGGADGIFLISHHGQDAQLIPLAKEISKKYPTKKIGVNLLGASFAAAYHLVHHAKLDMLWVDNPYIQSDQVGSIASAISRDSKNSLTAPEIFAGVAFKYRPNEPDPAAAAATAASLGFIPTTSGPGTGLPPDVSKIMAMRAAAGPRLAIASGITPENISTFLPMATDILVATGISNESDRFEQSLLLSLIDTAHRQIAI